jgi:putative inorganic carbon (HCO3(-)) transporter
MNTSSLTTAARLDHLALLALLPLAPLFLFPSGLLAWVGLGLVVLLTLARWILLGRQPLSLLDIPLLYLLGMALLGLLISLDRSLSWSRFWSLLYGLIVFATLRRCLDPTRQTGWIAAFLSLAGLGLAGVSLLGTDWSQVRLLDLPWLYDHLPALIRGLPGSGVPRASDLFNPRWVGISLGLLAPVYLALLGWRRYPWLRLLLGLAFLLSLALVLLTQSLQAVLGLLAGCFVVLVCLNRRFWILLPLALLALAGLALWLSSLGLLTVLLSLDNPVGLGIVLRLEIWSRALAMLHDLPYTGIGLNTFPLVLSDFYSGYLLGPEPHAHNLYLQTALDFGLPGLLALLTFLMLWLVQLMHRLAELALQAGDPGCRLMLVGTLAGMVSYLVAGLLDAMMLGAKPSFLVWALLGIGAACPPSLQVWPKATSARLTLVWLVLPLLVVSFTLFRPTGLYLNIGTLAAHHLLYPFPTASHGEPPVLSLAQASLQTALHLDPSCAQAHLLLARLAALQGDYPAAFSHYLQRLDSDHYAPDSRYNPSAALRCWLDPSLCPDPTADLLQVYRAWTHRFPARAEGYLLQSLLIDRCCSDPSAVQAPLQSGLAAGAQPLGLLQGALNLK